MNGRPSGKADPPLASRHRGREAAIQMLYQWEVGRLPLADVRRVWSEVTDEGEPLSADLAAFANALAEGVAAHVEELDPLISEAAAHWRIERMNVVDRLVTTSGPAVISVVIVGKSGEPRSKPATAAKTGA